MEKRAPEVLQSVDPIVLLVLKATRKKVVSSERPVALKSLIRIQ